MSARPLAARQPDRHRRLQQPAGRRRAIDHRHRAGWPTRCRAFGWYTQRIDGNDMDAVIAAFDAARNHDGPAPRVIVCDTLMGKGVPFLEEREKNHFIRVDPHEWDAPRRARCRTECAPMSPR